MQRLAAALIVILGILTASCGNPPAKSPATDAAPETPGISKDVLLSKYWRHWYGAYGVLTKAIEQPDETTTTTALSAIYGTHNNVVDLSSDNPEPVCAETGTLAFVVLAPPDDGQVTGVFGLASTSHTVWWQLFANNDGQTFVADCTDGRPGNPEPVEQPDQP